jgi:hypothetical protein
MIRTLTTYSIFTTTIAALAFALTQPTVALAQAPPPPTPTPVVWDVELAEFSVGGVEYYNPGDKTNPNNHRRPQFDTLERRCPVYRNAADYLFRHGEGSTNLKLPKEQSNYLEELAAFNVLECRIKGVLENMIAAGVGIFMFSIVWSGLRYMLQDREERERGEHIRGIVRSIAGLLVMLMAYLLANVFVWQGLTPYLPF